MPNFELIWKTLFDSVLPDGVEFVWEEGGYEKFVESLLVEDEEEHA